MAPMRLAVLVCGRPIPSIEEEYGDYFAMVKKLLQVSCPVPVPGPGAEPPFILDRFDVVHELEYPEDDAGYAGIFITGSSASAYDDAPWVKRLIAYVAELVATNRHVKLFGLCFGHQIIACALGGSCVPNDGKRETGVYEIELTPLGKELFCVDVLHIQQMHRDHVPAVPPTFHLLGSSAMTHVQVMARYADPARDPRGRPPADVHVLALQGHPEFVGAMVARRIDDYEARGVMDGVAVEEARVRARGRNDGCGLVGRVFWAVLGLGGGPGG